MAISQVTITANQIDAQRIGYQAVSLTNYDNTSEPQIASGSVVEIGGALFEAGSNESITGWSGISVDSDVYIKLTVSGATATASFTTSAPTWSTALQGWYSGSDRYIGGLYKDGSGNYTEKYLFRNSQGRIQTEDIQDLAIINAKIDKTSTEGSQAIGAGGTWVPTAGFYMITSPSVSDIYLEIYSGAWRQDGNPWSGGMLISDGTNIRLYSASALTVYYRKLI